MITFSRFFFPHVFVTQICILRSTKQVWSVENRGSRKKTCVKASFLIKLQAWDNTGTFQWILRNFHTFFTEHPRATTSVFLETIFSCLTFVYNTLLIISMDKASFTFKFMYMDQRFPGFGFHFLYHFLAIFNFVKLFNFIFNISTS